MNKFLKWLVIAVAIFGVLSVTVVILANNNAPEYEVIEETDREDSFNVKVSTNQTSEKEVESIVEDIEKGYDDVDAVWLWVVDDEEEVIATAKIPYNKKGEAMVGEEDTLIEYKKIKRGE